MCLKMVILIVKSIHIHILASAAPLRVWQCGDCASTANLARCVHPPN